MDFNQLKNFMAVARTGNISRAAQEMYVTQPSLSKSISRLEEELRVPLFHHRKGRIELNEYGSVFLSSVSIAFAQLESGAQTIQRMYDADQHILSLGSNIASFLPDILPGFYTRHPEIGIRQRNVTTRQMIDALLDRSLTLGISSEPIDHAMIRFQALGNKEFALAVHQDHPLADRDAVDMEALAEATFIVDMSRLGLKALQKLCQEHGFTPKVGFEVESTDLLFSLLDNNMGVAVIPLGLGCSYMCSHPQHRLRLIRLQGRIPRIIIGIASHKHYSPSAAAVQFEDYVMEHLAEEDDHIREMGFQAAPAISPEL